MFKLDLHFNAENEMSEAYDWYEEKQTGLGKRFYTEINRYLALIQKNPYHFQVRYPDDLRTAAIIKFPFLVIYWIDELNNIVYVLSVFHTSRDPIF